MRGKQAPDGAFFYALKLGLLRQTSSQKNQVEKG
jgi:hypothetical protein